jgi:GNAT superfamily N-acetyltransferase
MINHHRYGSRMDAFTVETMAEPIAATDLAGLVESLVGLWRDDAGRHDRSISPAWPHRAGAAYYHDLLGDPNGLVLAARAGVPTSGEIVGHLVGRFSPAGDFRVVPSAVLESMQVRSDLRGRGIGSMLVEAFLAWASQRQCARVTVTANAGNTGAQAFYRGRGFAPAAMTFQRTPARSIGTPTIEPHSVQEPS